MSIEPDLTVETVYAADRLGDMALSDLVTGLRRPDLWLNFALFDTRQRFRRSILGPIWISLSMCVMIGVLSIVYSSISPQPLHNLIPYLAAGLITWGLINSVINEGTGAFINAENFIRNVPMPLSVHVLRSFARNVIVWLFNMAVFLIVVIIFGQEVNVYDLLFVPGIVLLLLNLLWMSFVVATVSTRFRDVPQFILAVLQVVFFLTPIFWSEKTLPGRPQFIEWNPIFHLIEIVRAPLLGSAPSTASWVWGVAGLCVGIPLTVLLYRRAYARIAYWI